MNSEYHTPHPDPHIMMFLMTVMSHRHWDGLGDFIISRLQSYIPFLMKMLKMSTFGKLVLIENGTILSIFSGHLLARII